MGRTSSINADDGGRRIRQGVVACCILLLFWDCHDVVCVSILQLPPLSDHVLIVVVATAVVFQLHLEGRRHGDKDVDRGRVDDVDVDNGLLKSETNAR